MKIENVFLIFWLVVGLSIAIFTPPGVGRDEEEHIARAAQVAVGQFLPEKVEFEALDQNLLAIPENNKGFEFYGGETDKPLYNLLVLRIPSIHDAEIEDMNFAFPWWTDSRYSVDGSVGQGEAVTWAFPNTSVNSPLCYVPYSLGYAMAAMAGTSPILCVILMRIFGVIAYGLIVRFAIKKVPICKKCLFFIAILPNSIAVSTVVSADAPTNAFSFLFLAYVLRFLVHFEEVKTSDYVWLGASLSCLALLKMPYVSFGLLLILIFVANKMWTNRRATVMVAIIGIAALVFLFAWSSCIKGIETYSVWPIENVNQNAQIAFVLHHPMTAFKAFFAQLCETDLGLVEMTAYSVRSIPVWLTIFACIVFVVSDIQNCQLIHNRLSVSICFIALSLFMSMLIIVALYLTCTSVGSTSCGGVQSRYFVPVLFPIFCAIVMLFAREKHEEETVCAVVGAASSKHLGVNNSHATKPMIALLVVYAVFAFYAYSVWL